MPELVTVLVCVVTAVVSFLAFQDPSLRERLLFRPDRILVQKEWYRVFSSALIHADWTHLGFNLFSLYAFGRTLEPTWGPQVLLLAYVGAVAGGSLLSLFLHRNHVYAALGASGGVCGVIFASIFLIPGTGVGMFFIPVYIPGPLYALLYLAGTFLALRRGGGNIGHDAHFGGAITGMLVALVIAPQLCLAAPWLFGGAFLFAAACLFVLLRDPFGISGTITSFGRPDRRSNIRYQRYDENRERRVRREEIDRVLDKVSAKGIDSLSRQEHLILTHQHERSATAATRANRSVGRPTLLNRPLVAVLVVLAALLALRYSLEFSGKTAAAPRQTAEELPPKTPVLVSKRKDSLGEFQVVSGRIIASDPGYTPDLAAHGLSAIVENCRKGTWHAASVAKQFDNWYIVAELWATADGFADSTNLRWTEQRGIVGVDGGQAGIWDLSGFDAAALVPKDYPWTFDNAKGGKGPAIPEMPWYSWCCELTNHAGNENRGAVMPFGVVSNSGYGDGGYSLFVGQTEAGEVVALRIVFVDDEGRG